MPSESLVRWRSDRMSRLGVIDAQCAATAALIPPNPKLHEENLRGYIVLLSAHFQGYCRDLYTECAQAVALRVRAALRVLIQAQFTAHLALDHGNPNAPNLRKDFGRFGFDLDLAAADPTNPSRLQHLSTMNTWRNIAAHHGVVPPAGLPTLGDLRGWRDSCDGLATSLDDVMYNRVRRLLGRAPWKLRCGEGRSVAKTTSKKPAPVLKLGDLVKVRLHPDLRGRVVELRGRLGPGGAEVYRIRVRRKPKPIYIELLGDQLEVAPPDGERRP